MKKCYKCTEFLNSKPIHGLHPDCFTEWFGLPPIEFHDLNPKSASFTPSQFKIGNTFYHGQYLKYSAKLGLTSYILKVEEKNCPELPKVEYVCNKIASFLNMDVPPYFLIDLNGYTTFATRNFMQDHIGVLHHLYKFLPAGTQNHNCEEIIKVILAETGKLADVAGFIDICLFDSLVGNNDRHGRNLGIIETGNIKTLAPMYDNPSILGIQDDFLLESHFNPSGCIWTENNKEPRIQDYIDEFSRLGYKKPVTLFCNKIISKSEKIMNIIKDAEIGVKMQQALVRLVRTRIEEIKNAK